MYHFSFHVPHFSVMHVNSQVRKFCGANSSISDGASVDANCTHAEQSLKFKTFLPSSVYIKYNKNNLNLSQSITDNLINWFICVISLDSWLFFKKQISSPEPSYQPKQILLEMCMILFVPPNLWHLQESKSSWPGF